MRKLAIETAASRTGLIPSSASVSDQWLHPSHLIIGSAIH